MRTSTRSALPFFYALLISACSNSDNYPKGYIGFETKSTSYTYDIKNEEETISLKIIAAEKQDTDRRLTISIPTGGSGFSIQDPHPVIPKGKKSIKIDVTLSPKRINGIQHALRVTCTPDGKDAKSSEIYIRLQKM